MLKIKNVARLLLGAGAVMVSIHTAGILFMYCAADNQCMANVYFGVPEHNAQPLVSTFNTIPETTTTFVEAGQSTLFSDIHAIVQVTGLYLILIGIVTLLLLEFTELKYLRSSRLIPKRK
jgi:hypothetical protein